MVARNRASRKRAARVEGLQKSKESGLCYSPEPRICLARQAGPGPRI
jgi:hypothetical protein